MGLKVLSKRQKPLSKNLSKGVNDQQLIVEDGYGETVTQEDIDLVDKELIQELEELYFDDDDDEIEDL